jgi:hypothetical protein
MQAEATKGKVNKLVAIGAVAAIAVIGILVVVIVRLLNAPEPVARIEARTGGVGTVATIDNVDAIRQKLSEPVEDGYYETRMNVEWVFPTWDTPSSNAYVANAESNKRTVYFTVLRADTQAQLYSSPDIPVGSQLTDFALDEELAAGEYPAVVVYHLLDDNGVELTNVSVAVTLRVLS